MKKHSVVQIVIKTTTIVHTKPLISASTEPMRMRRKCTIQGPGFLPHKTLLYLNSYHNYHNEY